MAETPQELEAILYEIEVALELKLYYLAIAVSLSVPDICACLEFDPDKPSWADIKTYSAWWDTNIGAKFQNIEGKDAYYIRGGTLHRGNFEHKKSRFNRIMFIGPESAFKIHDQVVSIDEGASFGGKSASELRLAGKVLAFDVQKFCEIIMNSARQWATAKSNDPFVRRNMPNLVRYRPDGLPPFSVGVPTIA
jgi:hypothetical protein